MNRRDRDRAIAASKLPRNTIRSTIAGREVFIFTKDTEMGIPFEIAVYFDPDEGGYSAQLVSPAVEASWRTPHIGHLFGDGVICLGQTSMRTRPTLEDAYGRACLWAEGMAIMISSHVAGTPTEFPFSINNESAEAGYALRGNRS